MSALRVKTLHIAGHLWHRRFGLVLIELGLPRHRIERLANFIFRRGRPVANPSKSITPDQLTPHAYRIYAELRRALNYTDTR